jgi:hypothetical protein
MIMKIRKLVYIDGPGKKYDKAAFPLQLNLPIS